MPVSGKSGAMLRSFFDYAGKNQLRLRLLVNGAAISGIPVLDSQITDPRYQSILELADKRFRGPRSDQPEINGFFLKEVHIADFKNTVIPYTVVLADSINAVSLDD